MKKTMRMRNKVDNVSPEPVLLQYLDIPESYTEKLLISVDISIILPSLLEIFTINITCILSLR